MRVSVVSLVLAGALVALGACAAAVEPVNLTLAEQAAVCRGVPRTEIVPTGRQTGDVRQDYDCRSIHSGGWLDRQDRNVRGAAAARSAATDRALRGGA